MESLLREELREIVSNGAFGKNLKFVSFDLDKDYTGQNQYMSIVLFGKVTTSDESKYNVVIKLKLRDENMRVHFKIDFQFHNEITIYERVIPFLFQCQRSMAGIEDWPTFARFFYGRNKCCDYFERDLIVLENVNPLGFRLSEAHPFLDHDHLVVALQAIAKFHGLSYTAKYIDSDQLHKIATDLRDTQINVDGQWIFKNDALRRFGKRGVDRLLERSGDLYRDNEHLRRLNVLIDDGNNSLRHALVPREPFSVVCHGDFNRNNMLFRYDEAGHPVEVLLFDFGSPRYGSPAVDLSFFLYMNTTQKMRESRWDDLLNTYCLTLAETVPSGVRVPNRAELDSEMAKCAYYGFAHASFFLPHQLGDNDIDVLDFYSEETVKWFLQLGGDIGSDVVADIVQHIVDMKYTDL